ncbi:hypothetical protein C2S51_003577 [Perilla frutescens var. frutescens]|nr:hypothetical protein C2S51_003577 [Perilla frutescens var. frutescens]
MDEIGINYLIFPTIISIIFLWSITKYLCESIVNKNLPPSPPKLPILGNLHQLGTSPRYNLQRLAAKYGPLVLVHVGCVPVLIVSSAAAAREIMRTHDLNFASRPQYRKINFETTGVAFAPYSEYWRRAKRIFAVQLLNNKRVQSFRSVREEATYHLMKKIKESQGPVNLSFMFSEFTNYGICKSAFGTTYSLPWLSWIDRVIGYDEKAKKIAKGLDDFLEGVIQERLKAQNNPSFLEKNGENFLDIMLEIYNAKTEDCSIDRSSIKEIILETFVAGTESSAVVLEWAMTKLLQHPKVMEKLQKEVREIVGDKQFISDVEIEKMHYLKAVVKETFRYHPPVPLLLPRISKNDVKINGYDVPAGTVAISNVWAIGRDPTCWDKPEKFEPERFLNSTIDFKGVDFELIPFGAGRRGCPGIAFSIASIELVLANLMHKFNWKLAYGVKAEDLDMRECHGAIAHRVVPLHAVATQVN